MKSQIRRTLMVFAVVLALAAASSFAAAATTISFWHGYNELETQVLVEQVIPLFEESHPDIDVEAVRMGYDELRDKIVASAAGGAGPDVMRLDIIWTPGFGASGLLEPLGGYKGFDELLSEVYPGPLSTNRLDDVYYGLPLTTNTQIYIYNQAAYDAAGVTAPETIDEFAQVARRMTESDGNATTRFGYDIGGPWAWYLLPWIWSNGGAITDPEITTSTGYLDGAATVDALEKISEWAVEGILAPNIMQEGFDAWGGFVNGQAAARQDGPWFPRWMDENHPGFDAGYALMPAGAGGSVSVVGGENIAVASGSQNKDAAWEFVRFMLSYDAQSRMAAIGQIPVIKSAVDIPEFQQSEYYPVYLEQLLTAQARTPHPNYGQIEQIIQEAFWNAISGSSSARAALEDAARLVDAELQGE